MSTTLILFPTGRIMAENESLDLKSPDARRWTVVRSAAERGDSFEQVKQLTEIRFYAAIRRSLRQFNQHGVKVSDFIAERSSPRNLQELVRKTRNHDYAKLLASVSDAYPAANTVDWFKHWQLAILDKVLSQMCHSLVGTEQLPTALDARIWSRQIRNGLGAAVNRIALRLAQNPDWKPRRAGTKNGPKVDPTQELLGVSLVGR
jgi:hypothetical protein